MAIHAAGPFTVHIVAAAQANDLLRRVPSTGALAQDLYPVYAPAQDAPRTSHLAKAEASTHVDQRGDGAFGHTGRQELGTGMPS